MDDRRLPSRVDIEALPSHFEHVEAEARWGRWWDERLTYAYDPSRPRAETFVIDTPPPTVSGSLHIGHIFSYTHTDLLARYMRMRGRNLFYPMGWDDNGLPTERRVQNYFHVRVDVNERPDPDVPNMEPPSKSERKAPPRRISRPDFVKLCHRLTAEDEVAFQDVWRRVGLSVDWSQEYATIDRRSRRIAQLSFLDLHEKQQVYSVEAPTLWDVDFRTAVAQAELEDRPLPGHYHDIAFAIEGDPSRHFVISTTRPELLPACVGVAVHPEDDRYADLVGKRAVTPAFHVPVRIFASAEVERTKGTGIVMVCTFGDATDVHWWRTEGLPLRQIIDAAGRLHPVDFGGEGWQSLHPTRAAEAYASLEGQTVNQARARMVELLREPAHASAEPAGAPLQSEPRSTERAVKYFEKGDRPLEFITTRQWFVRLLDKKEALLKMGERVQWHPAHMQTRFQHWTQGLQFDWCISRQRFFGVSIPVWYPLGDNGKPDHSRPIVASADQLPVDPTTDVPPGYQESQRDVPGGFTAETDVFDTWFTSSMSPQIGSHWRLDPERHERLFPADLRPQSHEIIRTWAFYTIVKALLHNGSVPWHHITISGWVLDPDRKKMSKSVGNVVTPMHFIEQYSADAVRYWAASARLGTDAAFDQKVLKIGRRLVIKLYNVSKFVLSKPDNQSPITHPMDLAFLSLLPSVIEEATEAFEAFEHSQALAAVERFFWSAFTDTYVELVKGRAWEPTDEAGGSAVSALRLALQVFLRLFAPFLPYCAEEVWSWRFASQEEPSIHRAAWPAPESVPAEARAADAEPFLAAQRLFRHINKHKTELGASAGRRLQSLTVAASPAFRTGLEPVLDDLKSAVRCGEWAWSDETVSDESPFRIVDAVLEEPQKTTKG